MRNLMWILWPSFVVGGVAETIFFTVFDPQDLHLFGEPVALSRTAVYSIGFLLFWAFAAGSSALTCFLQRSADQINRCPLPVARRPDGCPNRGDPGAAG